MRVFLFALGLMELGSSSFYSLVIEGFILDEQHQDIQEVDDDRSGRPSASSPARTM